MKTDDYLAISEASDREALRRALVGFAGKMGFSKVNTLLVSGDDLDAPDLRIGSVGNTPGEFLQAHSDRAAIRQDPVLRRLMSTTLPFTYDQGFYVQAGVGHLWEEQAVYGYKYGLAASLLVGQAKRVFVGVDGPDRLPRDEVLLTRLLADLQLLAMHAHVSAVRFLEAPVAVPSHRGMLPKLTRRELEVLMWVAQGKSLPVTATILGLSPSTVKGYMESVLDKFEVSSKVQAIALAKAFGLLS